MRKHCIKTYKDLWFDLRSCTGQVVVGFSMIHLSDFFFFEGIHLSDWFVGAPSNQPSMSNDSLEYSWCSVYLFAFSIIAALLLRLLVVEACNVNRRNWIDYDWFVILNI